MLRRRAGKPLRRPRLRARTGAEGEEHVPGTFGRHFVLASGGSGRCIFGAKSTVLLCFGNLTDDHTDCRREGCRLEEILKVCKTNKFVSIKHRSFFLLAGRVGRFFGRVRMTLGHGWDNIVAERCIFTYPEQLLYF